MFEASRIPFRSWVMIPIVVLVWLCAGIGLLYFRPSFVEAYARRAVMRTLAHRFQSDVELQELHIQVVPRLRVAGSNLTLRYHGRVDVPPLIQIGSFAFSGGLLSLLRPVPHIPVLYVHDLQITIPPREAQEEKSEPANRSFTNRMSDVVVDQVICEQAVIRILPHQSAKAPLEWQIHQLTLSSASPTDPFRFQGNLTNGKPVGEIATRGQFGPWNSDDPGATPITGEYQFDHADLTPLPGIGGILSSTGRYRGVLTKLEVEGITDTPDFTLDAVGEPVPLHTEFSATVDGTTGDTQLRPVNATLGHSLIIAEGTVERVPGVRGHLISFEATVPDGRIQDFLKLATRSEKPILSGSVKIDAKIVLPPGKESALDKLSLDGRFGVVSGSWSNPAMREKLESLSRRALGKPQEQDVGSAITDLGGNFFVRDAVVHFRQLTFQIEGATVELTGSYALRRPGTLDLAGHLVLHAKLSQTVTGYKSLFLKAFDPFFEKKEEGAVLPIRITGTRENPVFSVTVFHKSFEKTLKPNNTK